MPNLEKNKLNSGFTLIELMVVVMIIAVLSGLVLNIVNPSGLRAKARDSSRTADLKRIQAALEAYFADNRGYPTSSSFITTRSANVAPLAQHFSLLRTGGYINPVPVDPVYTGSTYTSVNPCAAATTPHDYLYKTSADLFAPENTAPSLSSTYVLVARMEQSQSVTSACSNLSNWGSLGCGSYDVNTIYCQGVQNP